MDERTYTLQLTLEDLEELDNLAHLLGESRGGHHLTGTLKMVCELYQEASAKNPGENKPRSKPDTPTYWGMTQEPIKGETPKCLTGNHSWNYVSQNAFSMGIWECTECGRQA
jgi:hypothetical protein